MNAYPASWVYPERFCSRSLWFLYFTNRISVFHFLVPVSTYNGLFERSRCLIYVAPVTIARRGNQLFVHSCHGSVVLLMESLQTLVVIQS